MDILNKINKYTAPTTKTFFDTTNDLMKNIDTLESMLGGVRDISTKKSILKNIDMIRMQLINIMDTINVETTVKE